MLPAGVGVLAGSIDSAGADDAEAVADAAGPATVAVAVATDEAEGAARSPAGTQPDGATKSVLTEEAAHDRREHVGDARRVGLERRPAAAEKLSIVAERRLGGPADQRRALRPPRCQSRRRAGR